MSSKVFSFPNPVNEVSARLVAGGVVLMATATIAFQAPWMTAVIHGAWKAIVAVAISTTPPATRRADTSLTGFGNEKTLLDMPSPTSGRAANIPYLSGRDYVTSDIAGQWASRCRHAS